MTSISSKSSKSCPAAAAAALSLVLGLTGACSGADAAEGEIDLENYALTFDESFEQGLDVTPWGETPSRWIAHTPWAGDFGDARFADPTPEFPFTIHDGVLRIEARKDEEGIWESGLLSAVDPDGEGFAQVNGYFEARMKLPPGKGVWPAFWLVDGEGSEIDVIEYYGQFPDSFHSVWHFWGENYGGEHLAEDRLTNVPHGSLYEDFHTYGVDITDETVTIYLDRKAIWQFETPEQFVGKAFYPLVNLALGSGWPIDETPDPSYLWVDYIRVYQKK
jgi:hypothetical protein